MILTYRLSWGKEIQYIEQAVKNKKICGDGEFTKKCSRWMEERFQVNHCLLTTSCTHALEMAAVLSGIQPGEEVILPSYTFVSTAGRLCPEGSKAGVCGYPPGYHESG